MKWRNSFYQYMWFVSKKCVQFVVFRLFRFLGIVMKINNILQIENIDTLCCCNFNNKRKY